MFGKMTIGTHDCIPVRPVLMVIVLNDVPIKIDHSMQVQGRMALSINSRPDAHHVMPVIGKATRCC